MTGPLTTALDPTQRSLLHLHTASQMLLPQSQSVSSHLASALLSTALENDINLPKAYIESRFCQRCGTAYVPGMTCRVRSVQSRRQKRTRKDWWWVVHECKLCGGTFRTEVEVPRRRPPTKLEEPKPEERKEVKGERTEKEAKKDDIQIRAGKRRKRERLHGLRNAIEKSKAERTNSTLSLLDLMKPGT
jgi:RNase P subunit RPR2